MCVFPDSQIHKYQPQDHLKANKNMVLHDLAILGDYYFLLEHHLPFLICIIITNLEYPWYRELKKM